MTMYRLPQPPESGEVWDEDGQQWVETSGLWTDGESYVTWGELLTTSRHLSDEEPPQAGDRIYYPESYESLPPGSIVASGGGTPLFKNNEGKWASWDDVPQSNEYVGDTHRYVLRVGWN